MKQLDDDLTLDKVSKWFFAFFVFDAFVFADAYLRHFNLSASLEYGFDDILLVFLPAVRIFIPVFALFVALWLLFFGLPTWRNLRKETDSPDVLDLLLYGSKVSRAKYPRLLAVGKILISSTAIITMIFFVLVQFDLKPSADPGQFFLRVICEIFAVLLILVIVRNFKSTLDNMQISTRLAVLIVFFLAFYDFSNSLGEFAAQFNYEKKVEPISFDYDGEHITGNPDSVFFIRTKDKVYFFHRQDSTLREFERTKMSNVKRYFAKSKSIKHQLASNK